MSEIYCDRKKPFSCLEKDLVLKLINKYDRILSCKKTNGTNVLRKRQAWMRIQHEFNSSPIVYQKAAVKQLRKLWYNMKAKARDAKNKKNDQSLTCGHQPMEHIDIPNAKVIAIDKNSLANIKLDTDSDGNDLNMTVEDDNDEAWNNSDPDTDLNLISRNSHSFSESPETTSDIEKIDKIIITKDNIEKNNTSMCEPSMIQMRKEYINKINLLKIQILEEELDHKRRIHAEELKMKIKERETKEILWNLEIKEKENKIYVG